MTDSRLQELKRACSASGSIEDEAAYLRELVRIGELSNARLELAAHCGHEGARCALFRPALVTGDLVRWAKRLKQWDTASVRAVLVLGSDFPRASVAGVTYSPHGPLLDWSERAVAETQELLEAPTPAKQARLVQHLELYLQEFFHPVRSRSQGAEQPSWAELRGAVQHGWREHSNAGWRPFHWLALSLWGLQTGRDEASRWVMPLVKFMSQLVPTTDPRLRVGAELSRWALRGVLDDARPR